MHADGFYDNSVESNEEIMGIKGYEIKNLPQSTDLILAIGDNQKRKTLYEKYESRIHQPPIIHNGAYVNNTVVIKNCSSIYFRSRYMSIFSTSKNLDRIHSV